MKMLHHKKRWWGICTTSCRIIVTSQKYLSKDEGAFLLFLTLFLIFLQLNSWQVWWGLGQRSSCSCESMWQTTVSKLHCYYLFSDVSVTSLWSCDLLMSPFYLKNQPTQVLLYHKHLLLSQSAVLFLQEAALPLGGKICGLFQPKRSRAASLIWILLFPFHPIYFFSLRSFSPRSSWFQIFVLSYSQPKFSLNLLPGFFNYIHNLQFTIILKDQ